MMMNINQEDNQKTCRLSGHGLCLCTLSSSLWLMMHYIVHIPHWNKQQGQESLDHPKVFFRLYPTRDSALSSNILHLWPECCDRVYFPIDLLSLLTLSPSDHIIIITTLTELSFVISLRRAARGHNLRHTHLVKRRSHRKVVLCPLPSSLLPPSSSLSSRFYPQRFFLPPGRVLVVIYCVLCVDVGVSHFHLVTICCALLSVFAANFEHLKEESHRHIVFNVSKSSWASVECVP